MHVVALAVKPLHESYLKYLGHVHTLFLFTKSDFKTLLLPVVSS